MESIEQLSAVMVVLGLLTGLVDILFFFLMGVCGSVGLLVAVLLIYFCVRYRRRAGDVGNPPGVNESRMLEWFWTISPLGIFAVIFAWGGQVYFSACSPPEDERSRRPDMPVQRRPEVPA